MGDPAVALGEAELLRIGDYVKGNLRSWLEESGLRPVADPVSNTQLLERVVRVEDELKAQRELIAVRFDAMDRRFIDILGRMDDRFAAVDKRFEAVDKRFEAVDKRFDDQRDHFNKRFSLLTWLIGTAIVASGVVISLLALGF